MYRIKNMPKTIDPMPTRISKSAKIPMPLGLLDDIIPDNPRFSLAGYIVD
jgi:hypothetical protein